jgi:hypothetical protein
MQHRAVRCPQRSVLARVELGVRVLVACFAALLGPVGLAEAAQWRPVGTARGGVRSDGARWVVMQRSGGRVVVGDDLLGRRFAVAVRRSCFVVHVGGGGLLVVRCPSVSSPEGLRDVYDMTDLRSGKREAVEVPALPDVDVEEVIGVGRVWLRLRYSGYHYWGERYYSRITGEVRTADGPRSVPNLDDPRLEARLCDPLRRPRVQVEAGYEEGSPWVPVTYDGRAAAFRHPRRLDSMLWRCGAARPQRLTSGPSSTFGQTQLGGGWAVFIENRDITALRYRDGRRVHLPVPSRWKRKWDTHKAHTRRFVYLAVRRTEEVWRVYRTRLPRARARCAVPPLAQ